MFCARAKRAFTLLEVVISVAIIAMIAISIYRFIESSLRAIQISTKQSNDTAAVQSLLAVLQAQLHSLPPGEIGALLGDTHKFQNKAADELQWLCGPGNGLFTQFADGEYRATLMLKQVPKTNTCELGLRRQRAENKINTALTNQQENWVHLLDNVDALEVRYYDQRLNAWLEKWTDQMSLPSIIRIRLWRAGEENPIEAILALPVKQLPT